MWYVHLGRQLITDEVWYKWAHTGNQPERGWRNGNYPTGDFRESSGPNPGFNLKSNLI